MTLTSSSTSVSTPAAASQPLLGELLEAKPTVREYPLGYLASLDGIRGLMTLGVLVAHTRYGLFPGAMVFMDSFFAMSGYLITSLLIKEYQRHGGIDFKKFYVRRLKRLYPALIAMLSISLLIAVLFSNELWLRVIDGFVALTYISNYWLAFNGPGIHYNSHTWSLSIEEQFYLLWPITFVLLVRWFGLAWRTVVALVAMALAFWAWRIFLTYEGVSVIRLYNSFDTRADSLLFGCAMAVALSLINLADYPRLCAWLARSLVPIAMLSLLWGFTIKNGEGMRWYYYVSPLMGSIPAVICVAALVQPNRNFLHAVYEHPIPVFLGRICYGLYIWHYPTFVFLQDVTHVHSVGVFFIGWPIAFALAIASYYLIERPFMRARPV